MKVIHSQDEDIKLTRKEKSKIAILKLVDSGKYVEGVGIRDNEFYILTEDKADDMWLAYVHRNDKCISSRRVIVRRKDGTTKSY